MTLHLRALPPLSPNARVRISQKRKLEVRDQLRAEIQYDKAESNRQRKRRSECWYAR